MILRVGRGGVGPGEDGLDMTSTSLSNRSILRVGRGGVGLGENGLDRPFTVFKTDGGRLEEKSASSRLTTRRTSPTVPLSPAPVSLSAFPSPCLSPLGIPNVPDVLEKTAMVHFGYLNALISRH